MRARLALVLALAAAAIAVPAAGAQALTVYAAASLRSAFPKIQKATYSFGGSDTLQLQVEHGAPADVFVSAAPDQSRALFKEGRCTRPVTFATNVVVLLVPKSNPGHVHSVYSLRSGRRRIAVGTPGVPIGSYTRKLLARMRLSSILRTNTISRETDVAALTAKVALGSAEAGFAYATDGKLVARRTRAIKLPTWAQPPVRYQMCAVKRPGASSAAARSFIKRVVGRKGRRVLHANGFGLPPRG